MSRKRNTIIAVIITFIIICVFVIIFIYSKKQKEEEEMWNMALNAISDEELEYELSIEIPPENLFNDDTKDNFEKLMVVEDITDNKVKETNTKNKITGLVGANNINNIINKKYEKYEKKELKLKNKISWEDYYTPGHRQECRRCAIMSTVAALEAYFNKKYELKPKISLSRQYLTSYTDFSGCTGRYTLYYINSVTLNGKNDNIETRNENLKNKIKNEIEIADQFYINSKKLESKHLMTRTQYSIAAGEVPFGIPKNEQLPCVHYDACEIVKIDPENPDFAVTGMDLRIFDEIYLKQKDFKDNWEERRKTILTKEFCADRGDKKNNKFTTLKRNDDFEKIFVENYFKIDNSKDSATTIRLIKEALEVSPLIVGTNIYRNMRDHLDNKGKVWEKDENEEKDSHHGWVITGWGVDDISGREYWILKTSWSDTHFGGTSNVRIWINDPALDIEKQSIYGFSGEMVTIQGKELNKLLEVVKREEKEREKRLEEEQKKQIQTEIKERQMPKKTPLLDPKNIDPLKEYNIINIGYQDTRYISDNKCTTIVSCIYEKLSVFYTDKQNEFS